MGFLSFNLFFVQCTPAPKNETSQGNDLEDKADTLEISVSPLSLNLFNLDSARIQTDQLQHPLFIVFFSPNCNHCEDQIEEIRKNFDSFDGATFVMISGARLKSIRTFSEESGLGHYQNVIFAFANPVEVYNTYGTVPVPVIILYSKEKRKVAQFRGYTEPEKLIKALDGL
jgi:thioredoxin-related protein